MSLQDIIKKILADTAQDLQNIEAESAEARKALEIASSEKEAQDQKDLEARTAAALTSVDEKTASMARRENAKAVQLAKRNLLDKAMAKFLDSLLNADEALYTQICEKLIAALPFAEGDLTVPAGKEALMKKLAPKFNIKADAKLNGGFIATHGVSEIDNTFENLVSSEYKAELEMYLADQLKLV